MSAPFMVVMVFVSDHTVGAILLFWIILSALSLLCDFCGKPDLIPSPVWTSNGKTDYSNGLVWTGDVFTGPRFFFSFKGTVIQNGRRHKRRWEDNIKRYRM
jgi:hypothetical protein